MQINMPDNVNFIINTLRTNGYDAYIVGGCVRDSILGLIPKDWDITTSAPAEAIKKCFSDCSLINIGEQHGTIGVEIDKIIYEVTTYRIDGEYRDSRHPEQVKFTDKLEEDLARRDFTVNAMAYNNEKGLIDPYNGMRDLSLKALRCVGDPDLRFKEDALRILRALRFASTYNFDIEFSTAHALIVNRRLLENISQERIASEFIKMLCGTNISYILRRYKDVVAVFLPELVSTFDFEQNTPHHNKTVWKHTAAAVAYIEPDPVLRMTMILHDIGKPISLKTDSKGIDHFRGHNHFSAVYAETALERLKYSQSFISEVVTLIKYHDLRFSDNKKQIKHILNKIGVESFKRLLKVQKADILAQSKYKREIKLHNLELAHKTLDDILAGKDCFSLRDLAINGSDLIHLGVTNGKHIGEILNTLLDYVIDEETENDSVTLKKLALQINSSLNK